MNILQNQDLISRKKNIDNNLKSKRYEKNKNKAIDKNNSIIINDQSIILNRNSISKTISKPSN